jgi:hypothetical protein
MMWRMWRKVVVVREEKRASRMSSEGGIGMGEEEQDDTQGVDH